MYFCLVLKFCFCLSDKLGRIWLRSRIRNVDVWIRTSANRIRILFMMGFEKHNALMCVFKNAKCFCNTFFLMQYIYIAFFKMQSVHVAHFKKHKVFMLLILKNAKCISCAFIQKQIVLIECFEKSISFTLSILKHIKASRCILKNVMHSCCAFL